MKKTDFEAGMLAGLTARPLLLPLDSTPGGPVRLTAVEADPESGSYVLRYSDGSQVRGTGEFDDSGSPRALSDDRGRSVTFLEGSPVSASDKWGNTVSITMGGT